jgi:hypothetical protein
MEHTCAIWWYDNKPTNPRTLSGMNIPLPSVDSITNQLEICNRIDMNFSIPQWTQELRTVERRACSFFTTLFTYYQLNLTLWSDMDIPLPYVDRITNQLELCNIIDMSFSIPRLTNQTSTVDRCDFWLSNLYVGCSLITEIRPIFAELKSFLAYFLNDAFNVQPFNHIFSSY